MYTIYEDEDEVKVKMNEAISMKSSTISLRIAVTLSFNTIHPPTGLVLYHYLYSVFTHSLAHLPSADIVCPLLQAILILAPVAVRGLCTLFSPTNPMASCFVPLRRIRRIR